MLSTYSQTHIEPWVLDLLPFEVPATAAASNDATNSGSPTTNCQENNFDLGGMHTNNRKQIKKQRTQEFYVVQQKLTSTERTSTQFTHAVDTYNEKTIYSFKFTNSLDGATN